MKSFGFSSHTPYDIEDQFIFDYNLGSGGIYHDKNLGDIWYINAARTYGKLITCLELELFKRWDSKTLLPTQEQWKILEAIGGIPSSEYSLYPEYLEFPAKITTVAGKKIDWCLFYFSPDPPVPDYFEHMLFIDDVSDIEPSKWSLTHQLRLSSTLADEVKMSFYPFVVRTISGKELKYNGKTHFASVGDLVGKDIVSEVSFSYDHHELNEFKEVPWSAITHVIGKWDDRIEKLYRQYKQQLKDMEPVRLPPARRMTWWERTFGPYPEPPQP